MLINQQIQSSSLSGQVRLSPINTSLLGIGTAVTYGINAAGNVSALNPTAAQSGAFMSPQSNWSGFPMQLYPAVSATQFGQIPSGAFSGAFSRGMVQPSVDISESSSDVIVSAYVANVNVNDLRLNVTDNSVTISASAWTGNEYVVLNRTVALPTSIRAEAVDASLQSGVLEIRMPKADKSLRARTTISPDPIQAQ